MLKNKIEESLSIYTIKYTHTPFRETEPKHFEFNIVAVSVTDAIEKAKVLPNFSVNYGLQSVTLNCIAMKLKP